MMGAINMAKTMKTFFYYFFLTWMRENMGDFEDGIKNQSVHLNLNPITI
jgi:hypothetical protein